MSSLKERLVEILIYDKILKQEDLDLALAEQKKSGGELSKILVRLKFINEDDLTHALSTGLGMPPIDISRLKIDPAVVKIIPQDVAAKYQIIAISRMGDNLTLAMADPLNIFAIDNVKALTGMNIVPIIARAALVQQTIEKYYTTDSGEALQKIIQDMKDADDIELIRDNETKGGADDLTEDAPMIKLTDTIIHQGVLSKASDVFIEPMEKTMRIRYRVDGIIREVDRMAKALLAPIVSRIKVISSLDISEQRLPQDGRFKTIMTGNREVDFRVSILPTAYGEKVVLRILDKTAGILDLSKLGLEPDSMKKLQDCGLRPHGMILCCGPTGSGKTTTLYSLLKFVDSAEKNIITVEDPVEYQIKGMNQVNVRPSVGLTFAASLRSILRQDPDIIMVGEIRDSETLDISVKAALTGHLVLSSLHTTTAAGSIVRMMNMGIEPFLLCSSVIAIVGQRLIRRICQKCKEPFPVTAEMALKLNLNKKNSSQEVVLFRGKGCNACSNTGYGGRLVICEIMVLTPKVKEKILERVGELKIKETARREGMITMREDGLIKAFAGLTTLEEVLRVTAPDEDLK
ncbi:MAG: Flp pilus assembly complex ATPase component TadA [Candidatus Omnitrophica bacterium]|nr:Flp pilus assembly complex ATPase component TadA [Candidatus Omnitrophota bacterium]